MLVGSDAHHAPEVHVLEYSSSCGVATHNTARYFKDSPCEEVTYGRLALHQTVDVVRADVEDGVSGPLRNRAAKGGCLLRTIAAAVVPLPCSVHPLHHVLTHWSFGVRESLEHRRSLYCSSTKALCLFRPPLGNSPGIRVYLCRRNVGSVRCLSRIIQILVHHRLTKLRVDDVRHTLIRTSDPRIFPQLRCASSNTLLEVLCKLTHRYHQARCCCTNTRTKRRGGQCHRYRIHPSPVVPV